MIRILFVRTSIDIQTGGPIPPLGVLYLSSYIKKNIKDIDTQFFDFYFYSETDFVKKINEYNPHIVAFSSLTCERELLFELSKKVKEIDKNIITISGGPYPTISYDEVLNLGNLDFAVVGEGEVTFLKLIEFLFYQKTQSLINTAYIQNSKIFLDKADNYIDDLDMLPFPDWGILDIKKYLDVYNWNGINKNYRYMPILTSRGCPYGCRFCHNIFGKKFRTRSVKNVIDEIEILKNVYNTKEFHIIDDVFNYDIDRAKLLFLNIYQKYSSSLSFSFPNGIRADRIDKEMISTLKKSGCYKLYFGIESASDRIRNELMNKNINLESINKAVELCLENKIIPAGYFIFGYPGETYEDINKTLEYIKETKLIIAHFFRFSDYSDLSVEKKANHFFSYQDDEASFVILKAYLLFYFNIKRLFRIIFYSPSFIKGFVSVFRLVIKLLIFKIAIKFKLD